MNWFKHDASATQDAKLKKLIIRHGAVGYAIYFHCLELIAGDLSESNITFQLEHDSEIIADDLRIVGSAEKSGVDIVEEVMRYIISLGLFENNNNTITCMSMARRLDLSMTNNATMRKMISEVRDITNGFVYVIKSEYGCKIGKTKNYAGRIALFGVKLPFDFTIEVLVKIKNYYEIEAELHRLYADKLVNGEWYSICQVDIDSIMSYLVNKGGEAIDQEPVMTCHDRREEKREDKQEEKQEEKKADKPPLPPEAVALASLLFTLHREKIDAKAKEPTLKNLESWASDIDKLSRIDGRSWEEIERAIRWIKTHGCFWSSNIMSGSKLREKFDTVFAQMKQGSRSEARPIKVNERTTFLDMEEK